MGQFMYFAGVLIVAALVVLAVLWVQRRVALWWSLRKWERKNARESAERRMDETVERLDRLEDRASRAATPMPVVTVGSVRAEPVAQVVRIELSPELKAELERLTAATAAARRPAKAGARR